MISSSTLLELEPSELELETRRRFEQWLESVAQCEQLHARFANTLSLLEHIGSVKIARTQSGAAITAEVLQHLAEESRHADVLKRMVAKITVEDLDSYADDALLAGIEARGYFARLDAAVRAFARGSVAPEVRHAASYNLVTWLVERRAMWLYPAWQRLFERHRSPLSVRSIIGEETRHLEDVVAALGQIGLDDPMTLDPIVRQEELLFARLATSMFAVSTAVSDEAVRHRL